jgi:hypothetical protein
MDLLAGAELACAKLGTPPILHILPNRSGVVGGVVQLTRNATYDRGIAQFRRAFLEVIGVSPLL